MNMIIDAWILTIGNEIINGVITDTNRETISRELRSVGISIKGMSSVGDDIPTMIEEIDRAMRMSKVVVVSGGLGPTEDDKTSEAVAKLLDVQLALNEAQFARIKDRFLNGGDPWLRVTESRHYCPVDQIPYLMITVTAPGF